MKAHSKSLITVIVALLVISLLIIGTDHYTKKSNTKHLLGKAVPKIPNLTIEKVYFITDQGDKEIFSTFYWPGQLFDSSNPYDVAEKKDVYEKTFAFRIAATPTYLIMRTDVPNLILYNKETKKAVTAEFPDYFPKSNYNGFQYSEEDSNTINVSYLDNSGNAGLIISSELNLISMLFTRKYKYDYFTAVSELQQAHGYGKVEESFEWLLKNNKNYMKLVEETVPATDIGNLTIESKTLTAKIKPDKQGWDLVPEITFGLGIGDVITNPKVFNTLKDREQYQHTGWANISTIKKEGDSEVYFDAFVTREDLSHETKSFIYNTKTKMVFLDTTENPTIYEQLTDWVNKLLRSIAKKGISVYKTIKNTTIPSTKPAQVKLYDAEQPADDVYRSWSDYQKQNNIEVLLLNDWYGRGNGIIYCKKEFCHSGSSCNNIKIDPLDIKDASSFKTVYRSYAVDKTNAYYQCNTINEADTGTFFVLSNELSADKRHVYFKTERFFNADSVSFRVLSDRIALDKDYVYYVNESEHRGSVANNSSIVEGLSPKGLKIVDEKALVVENIYARYKIDNYGLAKSKATELE